jgi:cellulose synthase/poly-beta-1,6-N-acetylglucosamine synthase-like glycosyltransferase
LDTTWIELGFWVAAAVVAYVYVGYPAMVAALATLKESPPTDHALCPVVTLVFCVHNENPILEEKIRNCLALDYPRDRLEIVAGSDASTDGSEALLAHYQERGLLRACLQEERSGKTALLNRTVDLARGDILLFTDASTLLRRDGIRAHVRMYADPRVGCVGGELEFTNRLKGGVSAGHGFYWRYESWIRRSESTLGILAYVPGANYSMRRTLWRPVPPQFADDCVSPLNVVSSGHRVLYAPDAVAEEVASETPKGLFARRVRMVTRDLDATLRHAFLLNPLRHGAVALSLLSHKLLRWLVPIPLGLILLLNFALAGTPFFAALLILQLSFYGMAVLGLLLGGRPRSPWLSIPLYFCVSNLGAVRGLINVLLRRRMGVWQPAGTR